MTNAIYNKFKLEALQAILNGVTIKAALLTSSYTPNLDTDTFWSDISANEVPATGGYTAGGKTLTTVTFVEDTVNDRAYMDADDLSWSSSTITARILALYISTGNSATSKLIGYLTFLDANNNPADKVTNGDTFYVQWATVGNGAVLYAS